MDGGGALPLVPPPACWEHGFDCSLGRLRAVIGELDVDIKKLARDHALLVRVGADPVFVGPEVGVRPGEHLCEEALARYQVGLQGGQFRSSE